MVQLDLNEVVEEAVALVRHEALRHDVAMRLELAPGLPPVRGDRIQLQQVLINFLVNGMEAMATVRDQERGLIARTKRDRSHRALVPSEAAAIRIPPELPHQL